MIDREAIRLRWQADGSKRDERGRRLFAASEVRAAGRGGLAAVSRITGLARSTIERGLKDIDAPPLARGRVRREGGGTRRKSDRDATLLDDLTGQGRCAQAGRRRAPIQETLSAERTFIRVPISKDRGDTAWDSVILLCWSGCLAP